MQVRFKTGLTSEQYVSRQAWREARLPICPMHPGGGCGLMRHGTYVRKRPAGTQIARWYCPRSHTTVSLLPDCLAARLPGTLAELETVVALAEQARSLEAAANALRTDDVSLTTAMRWVRRRVRSVHLNLTALIGLLPDVLAGLAPTVAAFRQRLGPDVLIQCRALAHAQLGHLPAPVGLQPPASRRRHPSQAFQHSIGPDPKARDP